MKTNQTLRFLKDRKNILHKVTLKSCLLLLLSFGMIITASAQQYQRVYANTEQHSAPQTLLVTLSSVVSPSNAVDGNPYTKDTLSTSVGALGLIQATQNLQFTGADKPASNTPITLKIGFGSSILNLLGGITVQATLNGVGVGTKYSGGELAGLLGGSNMSEVTFTPGVAYDGVQVTVTPTLGVGVTANLYGAYFLKPATTAICSATPIDELDGVGKYLSGVNLANFAGNVANPMNALDGNENTYATVYASVGVAAYTQETAIFASPSTPGDSASVILSNPGGLLNLGVLQNSIQILTYNGNTVVDSVAGNTSLLTLQLLQGAGNKVAVRFKSKGTFDRIQFRLGGVVNVLPSINLYEMEMVAPAPTINIGGLAGDSSTICSDSSVTLSVANPEAGATYYWEDSTGSQVATGTSYVFASGQAPGTYRYYVKEFRAACTTAYDSAEAVVNVELARKPTIILPTKDTTISQGQSVTLEASSSQTGATVNWYTSSTGGTPIRTGQDTIHVTPADTTTYYAETALGNCTSATRAAITVNVQPALAAPEVVPDTAYVTIGQTATFRIVNVNKTVGYGWFTTPSGGTSISSDTTYTTGAIQADSNYYVEAIGPGGNVSTRTHVVVIALQPPASVFCNTPNAQTSPLITGICLLCNVYNPDNAIDADSTTASNIRGTVGLLGSVGQLLKFQHTGKTGDSIRMTLATSTGLLDLGLLNGVSVVFYKNGQAVGTYGLNDALLHLRLLDGVNKSYVTIVAPVDYDAIEIRLGGVATALTSIDVYYVQQLYPMPTVRTDTVAICPGDKATLTAALPSGSTDVIGWFSAAVGGTMLNTGTDYTTPVLSDTTIYYVTSARVTGTDTCWNLNRIPAVVNVGTPEPPSVVSDSVQVCLSGNVKLQVNNPQTGYKYIWYSTPTGGTALDTATSYAVNHVMKDTAYYVGLMNTGGCISTSRTKVNVIVTNSITPPVLASDTITATIGQSVTFSIAQADTANFTYRWYADSTTTTVLATGATYTPPAYSSTGTYSYYVDALAKSGCLSNGRTRATAIISGVTAAPCNTPNAQTSPVISGICLLCNVYNPDNAIDADSTTASNIRGTVGLLGSVGQLLKFQHAGKTGDSIRMTLATNTGLLDLGVLNGVSVVFYQNGQAVGTYPLNNALLHLRLLQGVNKSYITIVAPVDYDAMEIRLGGVATALTSIDVYYVQQLYPMPTVRTDTVAICPGDKATLTAALPSGSTDVIGWFSAPAGGTLLHAGTDYTTPVLSDTTVYYVSSARVTGTDTCWNQSRIPAVVNVGTPEPPAVVSDSVQVCLSGNVKLQVSNPQTGSKYIWYSTPTGGTALDTATSYAVNNVMKDTAYYVGLMNTGGCISTSRTKVNVISTNNITPPVLASDTITATIGQAVTFSIAQADTINFTYRWYADSTTTTVLATGAAYTPPAYSSTGTYSYYVDALATSGCLSNGRTRATAIISGVTAAPCNTPNAQTSPVISGICLLCNVYNPDNAIDADSTTASNIRGTVGLLGSVGQLLKFQHAGKTGDSIRMTLATNTGLLDLGVLNGVSVVFYESGKAVGTYALNDALLHLRLLDGVNKSYATIVAPVDYDAMEIRLGGVATALTSIDVYYVQQLYPMPAIVSDTATICYGDSTSFTATPAPNTIVGWYASSTGGTVLSTNSIFTTPALTQSMTYYVTAARVTGADTCWDSNRMPVVVKVNPRARAVDIEVSGADTICTGEMATLQASSKTVADSIFSWYSDATLKSKLFTGSIFKVSPTATTTYYVTVEGTGFCENAPDSGRAVTITVNPRADSMDITVKGDTVCSGEQATLQASSTVVPNGIFTWYSDPKLTNKLYTGASYTISPTNVTTYYVTVQGNGFCENAPDSAKSVTVVVNPRAKAGDINMSGPDTICAGEQATLQAGSTVVPNPIFNWYSDAKLTNKLYTGASYAVTPSGTTTYYVTVLGTGFCENEPDSGKSVTIVVNPRAQAGDIEVSGGSTICEGDTVTLAASSKTLSNAIFTWYSDSQLKNKLATGTTFKVIPDVTTTYYVTAQGSGFCENAPGDAQIVTVTVNPVPKTPVVSGPAGAICANTTATLEITNAQAGVTYNWYSVATGGTALATGTTYTTAALQAATTYYVAGAVTGGCAGTSSRTSVTVTVSQVPEPPKVQAADVTVCIGSRATFEVASPQTGITYNWYTTPTGGTPLTSGTTFTTSPLQSDSTYYVEADAGGGCPSTSRTQVNAKVVGLPPAPTVNLSANPVCPDSTVTLTASSGAQGVTYKWYDSPTGGNLLFTGNPYTTQPLTATTTYYVETVNAGGCANTGGRASVTVVVLMQLPTPQVIVDTATINSITFAWEPVPGAVGYQVSTDNGTTWQQPSSGATGLTHTVTGLQLNQSVTIIVKALAQSSCQNSQPSQAVTGTTKGSPLGDYIFVPNAFSPNGDGLNDVWQVYGNNISKLQVMVYNQYGQKIFESHSQQDGWDGTYQGKKQPVGVYVYYLQITFTDGKTETKKGDINLIR